MEWSYKNICSLWEFRREDMKERKKKGRMLHVLSIVAGGILAIIWPYNKNSSFLSFFLIICVTVIICNLIHAIVHETGHLIGGLISGYRLISFRIFLLTFVKIDNHFKIKLQKLKGTGGQCLMLPPKGIEFAHCPYYLYIMGGIFFDMFITILVFFSAVWLCKSPLMKYLLLTYVVFGILLAIINYIPLPNVTTDGTNLRAIRRNKLLLQSFLQQLVIYQTLCAGKDFHEFTEEEIEIPKDADITEPINSLLLNIQYMKCLKIKDFKMAEDMLSKMESEYESMTRRMQFTIDVERLYLLLIQDVDIRGIKTHYKNIKKDMKKNKNIPSVLRTLYAYERIIHKEKNKVIPFIKRINVMLHTTPIKQEIQLNIELMEWVEKQIIAAA
ncbi:hypothetical protein [Lachnoclostridium phytofermentans]|uniref:Peptidase M50 domain-containing protein n=1 Tax=Lachnoclostridium phytofermentans (strain ATCC 700394 / DSM 18823 / ISDg) TaxID=357809 RepID=A9KJ72_LACP7|nr:hypothetical protein [Lachnoclostridium phytofermentans]ABX42484.1 hypothetical protein Cphy_2118 [Lachnoclostridium phytofermentans ISDg]